MSDFASFAFGFVVFGFTPLLAKKAKHLPAMLGLMLPIMPYVLPIMAFAGFYSADQQMGLTFSGATLGWWLAIILLKRNASAKEAKHEQI